MDFGQGERQKRLCMVQHRPPSLADFHVIPRARDRRMRRNTVATRSIQEL
jgi:hypothetical protein